MGRFQQVTSVLGLATCVALGGGCIHVHRDADGNLKSVNVTGPEVLSVRAVCEQLGRRMNKPVRFVGAESDTALLSDASLAFQLFGLPHVSADTLIPWVADWIGRGGPTHGKPTHFEASDGRY